MKVMCMYLPQYHSFPENDEWWGRGYTEWVAVKGAKPLFRGHCQPRAPLGGDYYDLDKDGQATLKRQAALAKQYGIANYARLPIDPVITTMVDAGEVESVSGEHIAPIVDVIQKEA